MKTDFDPNRIDAALNELGDWLRFDGWTWLLVTNVAAQDISDSIRRVLAPEDSVMVIRCDPADYSGFAPKWVWDWIEKFRLSRSDATSVYSEAETPRNPALALPSGL